MIRFVAGDDGAVWVIKPNAPPRMLGHYEWGKRTTKCAELAKVMLEEMLDDDDRVYRLRLLFMQRFVEHQKLPRWSKTDEQLMPIIDSIEKIQREAEPDVRRMAREPPVGMVNAGGMVDESQWGSRATGVPVGSNVKQEPPTLTPNRRT
jgi:hypothetical protein